MVSRSESVLWAFRDSIHEGAAHNHRERVVTVRSELRNMILSKLRKFTRLKTLILKM
jgi:hypothetical protein